MADPTRGPARELIAAAQVERFRPTIISDEVRDRPLYFDGRFLAARDLIREQNYFLIRQADLSRQAGSGIVHGLDVTANENGTLRVTAGHGITAAGELVILQNTLESLSLRDIPATERLDASFGIRSKPSIPARNRTGVFLLAVRPVEFTANPIAAYPTSITGRRTVEDGDIIEATAFTLIPYPIEGSASERDTRRARAALDIFVFGNTRGIPAEALPLAMLALDHGQLVWMDSYLVRREIGAERSGGVELGFARRALREAHFQQYERHLQDVVRQFGARFAASEHFRALPPAGRMPAAAINAADFTQIFFPPEVDVDVSIIPEDEIPALIESSLSLPPIDLTLNGPQLESTSVLVLAPVPRSELRALQERLTSITQPLRPAVPGLIARRRPIQALQALTAVRFPVALDPQVLVDATWRTALAGTDNLLWYVRRRNLHFRADVLGATVPVRGNPEQEEAALREHLNTLELTGRYEQLRARGTAAADTELVFLLAAPKFRRHPLLIIAAMHALEREPVLDRAAVLRVGERFADPELGEGVVRLNALDERLLSANENVNTLARSGVVPQLDRLARVDQDDALRQLIESLLPLAQAGEADQVAGVVLAPLQEVEP